LHNPCEKFDAKKLLLKTFVIFTRTENEGERVGEGEGYRLSVGVIEYSNIRKLNNRIIELIVQ
jgi:hypothetical protein